MHDHRIRDVQRNGGEVPDGFDARPVHQVGHALRRFRRHADDAKLHVHPFAQRRELRKRQHGLIINFRSDHIFIDVKGGRDADVVVLKLLVT